MKTLETIEEIIEKLDQIIEWSKENKSTLGYFASTYRSTTIGVLKGVQNNKFEDGPRMVKLDIAFANRYFEALENYQNNKKCTNAWYTAFEATKNDKLLIMQHILLGMNAHINLDLGVSAAAIMPLGRITPLKKDFNKINEVISSINQKVQDSLSEICYSIEYIDKIAKDKDNIVLDFAISKARETAWATAYIVSNSISFIRPSLINMVDNAATLIATNILISINTPKILLQKLKECESDDVVKNIEILAATKI